MSDQQLLRTAKRRLARSCAMLKSSATSPLTCCYYGISRQVFYKVAPAL